MAVKIRLARHGKKNFAFFHIIVARPCPRDGVLLSVSALTIRTLTLQQIELNNEKALKWLFNVLNQQRLAQDLSYKVFF